MRLQARMRPALATLAAALALAGCARAPAPRVTFHWLVGAVEPEFAPDAPDQVVRRSIEHWLSTGLVERDSSGAPVPGAATGWAASDDSLTWSFSLPADLRYTDGSRCTSLDFKRALTAGLGRPDHATAAWLLGAVVGVDRVRTGRPLPILGIETPDARTLVLRLARRDGQLLARLASPGFGVPWKQRAPEHGWNQAIGLGPYRVLDHEPGRLLRLGPAPGRRPPDGPDTLEIQFAIGVPRVRGVLRAQRADLVWPLPPGLLAEPLPAGMSRRQTDARPARHLLLVMRSDTPPTTRLEARAALAHALNFGAALRAIGAPARPVGEWPVGAGRFEFPAFDADETRAWMARGGLGRSFHVDMGYDADGAGAAAARTLQVEWARLGLDVALVPLRGEEAAGKALVRGPQLFLAESRPPIGGVAGTLATLVMPLRGPAVGGCRTGWRTREFDPWILPSAPAPAAPLDVGAARQRLEEECIALPVAELPWTWVVREAAGTRLRVDPAFGPACVLHVSPVARPVGR